MKSLITDRIIQIERKGLEHMTINNMGNFLFTTNHSHTIKLERDDRRYACFEVSERYKNNEDYFSNLIDCMTEEAGNHFYTYCKNYPDSELVNLRKIPNTRLRQEMIQNSLNNACRFMEEFEEVFTEHRSEEFIMYDVNQEEKQLTFGRLYFLYTEWCIITGEKKYNQKQFKNMIKQYILEEGRTTVTVLTDRNNVQDGENKIKQCKWVKLK